MCIVLSHELRWWKERKIPSTNDFLPYLYCRTVNFLRRTNRLRRLVRLSKNTANQAMKLGQVIQYNKRNILLQKSCRNEAGRLLLYKTLDYWSRDILIFYFLEKDLGIVSPPYFVYDFSTKVFLMLYSINWPNCVWLRLLLEILGNMCIAIACLPGCDVMNFEINLIFLIKPFLYMTKKSTQKLKYLENEKSF